MIEMEIRIDEKININSYSGGTHVFDGFAGLGE